MVTNPAGVMATNPTIAPMQGPQQTFSTKKSIINQVIILVADAKFVLVQLQRQNLHLGLNQFKSKPPNHSNPVPRITKEY